MRKRVSPAVRKHLAYVRVSSVLQAASGISLEDQEERLRADAAARGVVLDEIVHDDGRSGSNVSKRPGMKRILEMVARGEVATLSVVKFDRAFRGVNDMSSSIALMSKHGCEFISLSERIDTGSAMGKMMINMLGAFAQFERDLAGERTSDALRQKRSQGRVYSKVTPYGFRRDGDKLEVDTATKPILDRIVAMNREGTGPTGIARTLNSEGVPSPGGSTWYASSVASVLNTAARFS